MSRINKAALKNTSDLRSTKREQNKKVALNISDLRWDLLLNKPYGDGGFENSSRVFGAAG